MLAFLAEMEFACLYAMRRPKVARAAAHAALDAAHKLGRPDLAYRANELLGAL